MKNLVVTVLVSAAFCGCGDDDTQKTTTPPPAVSPEIENISFEVDYQTGAEPYTVSPLTEGDTWRLFQTNVEAIYSGTLPQISMPHTIAEMESIGPGTKADYDSADILKIADEQRTQFDTDTSRAYYIVFLDGFYRDEDGQNPQVLGVSIGDTRVIAMFKPVYAGHLGASFIEQTTLIHEYGHAIGLVNRGIPLTSDHHDAEHGAHCTNPECVMYWQNEGLADIIEFVQRYVAEDDVVVFGPACLADIAGQNQ